MVGRVIEAVGVISAVFNWNIGCWNQFSYCCDSVIELVSTVCVIDLLAVYLLLVWYRLFGGYRVLGLYWFLL